MIKFIQMCNNTTISSALFTKIHEDWVKGHWIFICLRSILTNNTRNNSLCWPNGLSCRNVPRLCPVNFKLRAVLTSLYDVQISWWWITRTYIVASIVFQDFFFATSPPPPPPFWKNTVLNGNVIKWRILLSTICSCFLSKWTLYKILFSRKHAGSEWSHRRKTIQRCHTFQRCHTRQIWYVL